jgi:CheY-like chemotaxis protein
MPGMDGFETAELIRQRKSFDQTPIIFVTAFADEMHAARWSGCGRRSGCGSSTRNWNSG